MAREKWRGAERVYAWSFWSQGTDQPQTSADPLIDAALRWFGDAESGEVRLYLTDCHLESARLALTLGDTDKAREHWQQARDLIAQTGYHRRDGELADLARQLGISVEPLSPVGLTERQLASPSHYVGHSDLKEERRQ